MPLVFSLPRFSSGLSTKAIGSKLGKFRQASTSRDPGRGRAPRELAASDEPAAYLPGRRRWPARQRVDQVLDLDVPVVDAEAGVLDRLEHQAEG
jgi:hypothetical protein